MVLQGNLSTDKGTQTQPNSRSQDMVWRREKGMSLGRAKLFLLIEVALPVTSSSLTSRVFFLLGGESHPSPHEGGSKRKLGSVFA